MAGRHAHILRAFDLNPPADSLLGERLATLKRWNSVQGIVGMLLLFGLVSAAATTLANLVPAWGGFWNLLRGAAGVVGGLAGLLTITYLVLARLLGQIEADILVLAINRRKTH